MYTFLCLSPFALLMTVVGPIGPWDVYLIVNINLYVPMHPLLFTRLIAKQRWTAMIALERRDVVDRSVGLNFSGVSTYLGKPS